MIDKIAFAAARLVRGSFTTCAASALLVAAAVSVASAQPKPGAQPAKPAAAAPAQAAPGAPPQLIYSPWAKQCGKAQDAGGKTGCVTTRSSFAETGFPAVALALIEPDGEKKVFRITVPELPVAMAPGMRLVVDQGAPVPGAYLTCFRGACIAETEATPDIITKMKSGQNLFVQVVTMNNQVAAFPFPLADFKKVNEGPASDPKVLEGEMKKLMEDLQKRQQATIAQIQQQQQQLQQQQQAQQPPPK
jgi:invasion protein IalB